MTTMQTLTPMLDSLPQDALREVMDFVAFLQEKNQRQETSLEALEEGYKAMAKDELHEAEAVEWVNATTATIFQDQGQTTLRLPSALAFPGGEAIVRFWHGNLVLVPKTGWKDRMKEAILSYPDLEWEREDTAPEEREF
jgi:hypothetical protein